MKKYRKLLAVILTAVMIVTSIPVSQAEAETDEERKTWLADDRLMKNDYIGLFVADGGRFSIGTTGGNPDNERDSNKNLLYGYDKSSSSSTTFRINGTSHPYNARKSVFDTTHACNEGEMDYEDLHISQKLSFLRNSATGREDVVEIRYTVVNKGEKEENIGCRIMMDTQIGRNDSAPFRIPGIGAVTTETEFEGEEIPQIWQAFDGLSNPGVVAQGRFYKSGDDRPDKVQFARWRNLYNTDWDYKINKGAGNGDSAVAVTWHEKPLAPGEEREYVTWYGLSELTQDLGAPLTLSVYSEAELEERDGRYIPNPFPVNAYVENTGKTGAEEVRVRLELPKGLELANGSEETITLGNIKAGGVVQAGWQVLALPSEKDKDYTIRAVLSYDNGSSRTVTRKIHVPAAGKPQKEVPRALSYTLFSGSREQDLSMYGWKSCITGDIYTGRNFIYSGSILDIQGKVDAAWGISTNGWQIKADERNEKAEPVEMPDLKADIEGKIKEADSYEESVTFTEDKIRLGNSVRAKKDITFAGTVFEGSGYVTAGGNITCGLNQGKTYNDGRVVMYSENGNITLNGTEIYLDGILYAPNGTVSVNANIFHLKGRIIAGHIIMNASQVSVEGQAGDAGYIFDGDLDTGDQEEGRGSYSRTFTTDEDFAEGSFHDVSQRVDDELVLEYADSGQIQEEADTREYDAGREETGFTVRDTLSRQKFQTGDGEAVLTYELESFVRGVSGMDPDVGDIYDYVAPAAGRKVVFETTIFHGEHLDTGKIRPEADCVMENEDGSVTLQWKYDRLAAGEHFIYHIPLTYKGLSEEGLFAVAGNTALLYYDEEGDSHITYLDDRYAAVADSVPDGSWEAVCDAGKNNTDWNHVEWNGIRPDDSDIMAEVCVSDDGVDFSDWVQAVNGGRLEGVQGRYLKVRAVLKASSGGMTPRLQDLTVSTQEAEIAANAAPELLMADTYEAAVGQAVGVIFESRDDAKGTASSYTLEPGEGIYAEQVMIQERGILERKVTFCQEGTYQLRACVSDGELAATKDLIFHVSGVDYGNIGREPEPEEADSVCPVVEITRPALGETADGRLDITGSASDDRELLWYLLTYRGEGEQTDHLITRSADAVTDGILGVLDTSVLPDGKYVITLTAGDSSGNQSAVTTGFSVEHKQELDVTPPEADITGIAFNDDKTKLVITGTVRDDRALKGYTLAAGDPSGNNEVLAQGQDNIENDVIGYLDIRGLESGDYILTLTAEDTAGNQSGSRVQIQYHKGNTGETDPPSTEEPPAEEPSVVIKPEQETTRFALALSRSSAGIGDAITGVLDMGNINMDTLIVTVNGERIETKVNAFSYAASNAGELVFHAAAEDKEGKKVSAQAVCRVYNLQDKTPPAATISSPKTGMVLTEPVDFVGSAYDDGELDHWKLEYRMAREKEYILLNEGTEPVKDGVLGHLDTTMLMNGRYEVRLTVQDEGGNVRKVENDYVVEGELKVGAMHIGFTDITAKMGGTTVSANRMYDSRNKAKGDFGIGWTLGVQGMEVCESSTPLSEGYDMVKSGSLFSTSYQMTETADHDVVVAYGDGTSDRFELAFTPEKQALVPISEVRLGYRCVTDQKVKLEIIGDTAAYVSGSELVFYDEAMEGARSYKLTTEDGTKVYIKAGKGVYKMEDRDGNAITVDKNGYHAEDGRGITFARDKEDRIIRAEDPAGNVTSYAYDDNGDLVSVTDAADRTVTFTYDKEHNLASITDPMGIAVARNEYDDDGRLIATIDADGNRVEYDYDVEGRTQSVKDRRGNTTVYTYDDNGNVLQTVDVYGNKTTNSYDKHNNLLSSTDAKGNTTGYAYDASGNVTEVTAADGTKVQSTYTQENLVSSVQMADKTVMAMEYDSRGRISSVEDANGNETAYRYTSDGRLTGLVDSIGEYQRVTYDSEGNIASTANGAGESASYTYDQDGRVTSITVTREEEGTTKTVTSHYSYNAAGDITESIDNAGNVIKYEYDDNGRQTASIDAKGRRITYAYDDMGNMIKTTYPDGTFESFTYDANGNNITATDRSGLTVTMVYDKLDRMTEKRYADGTKESYAYDEVGNVTGMTSASGARTVYAYDERSRNTAVTDAYGNVTSFAYDASARLTKRVDAKGNAVTYMYDDNGNMTKTTYADGSSVASEYDARNRITRQEDPNGNETIYTYDGADRLTKVTDACGNSYTYGYDGNGNLVTVTDAGGHVTRYAYDDAGRVNAITNALGKTMEYAYDETGNLVRWKDYAGTVAEYVYDDMDRMVKKTIGTDVTEYSYDRKGLLLAVTDKSGTTEYAYDRYDRLTKQKDAGGNTLSYTYDKAGRLETFDNGFGTTAYEYDLLDRVTKVIDRNGKATVYEYDALGNRSAVRYPNGNVMSYTYDACQRLQEECITNADGVLLSKYSYGLGRAGERLSVTEINSGVETETTYKYDKLNRLVKETIEQDGNRLTNAYKYDAVSNRISKETSVRGDVDVLADMDSEEVQITEGTTTYTYNALNQLVTEASPEGNIAYTYDANGNLVKQTGSKTVDYVYDKENHLTRAAIRQGDSVTVESYTYDYAGNRTSKTVNEKDTVCYINDTSGSLTMVVAEIDENGKEAAYYTRGDELLSMERGGEVCYYLYDGHGSVRTLTNEAGRITDRYSYDAYGNLLKKEGDTENDFLYTGEQYNVNTGLYYLRARYMNPSTGTFISMDSYQGSVYDPVSLHKYLYANANPVMYTDPSGYATDKNLAETAVAATIAVMLASSVALHNQAMLNIFSNLRKNMADAVMSLPCSVSVTDWKNVILGFPAQEFDTKWLITIPVALTSWQLFEAIYATEEDTGNIPGVPAEEQEEKDKVESIPAEEQSGVKVYSDYITDNRVPLDNETILGNGTFQKTKIRVKGATVYKKGNRYYYRDTLHTGESAHLEVFDKSGNHLGEADPKTGEIRPGTADSSKKLNVR